MAQDLILPINNYKLMVGSNSAAYVKYTENNHGGVVSHGSSFSIVDKTDNEGGNVWGSGNGTVIVAGWGDNFGNVAVIKYPNTNWKYLGCVAGDLIFRYYHMASVKVKAGQIIVKDSIIGTTGRTGKFYLQGRTDVVRIEIDKDLQYVGYSGHLNLLGSRSNY